MNHISSPLHGSVWESIAAILSERERFLITTHVHPDGDGLGAELGLWGYLRSRGKDVRIVNADRMPPRYQFLDDEGQFECYDPDRHAALIADREVVFLLDFARWERLGPLAEPLRASGATIVCIDHHPAEDGPADLYGVDESAASTGQLVYELIRESGNPLDRRMATGLYVSLVTDTGSFRFSNSDPRAHRAAADLLEYGLQPNVLYERVYGDWGLSQLMLLGRVMCAMAVQDEGKIIVLPVTLGMLRETQADPTEAEGFVDIARSAAACECVVLLLEKDDGSVKVSLRSKGRVNVNRVATVFGGGGHLYASGATIVGELPTVAADVVAAVRAEMDRAERSGS